MIQVAIFASGKGSNARNLYHAFQNHPQISICGFYTNKVDSGVVDLARTSKIPCLIFHREDFYERNLVLQSLKIQQCNYIILAGFLWKIPQSILDLFPEKIINIHPALLPKYGGKGMYGMHVHNAVKEMGETETGITIHLVNEEYDKGNILFQAKVPVLPNDSAEDISEKIHQLEAEHFARVVEEYLMLSQ